MTLDAITLELPILPITMKKLKNTQPDIPGGVAQVLSYLANLIDSDIEVRGLAESPRAFAARYLDVPLTEVSAEQRSADPYEFFTAGRAGIAFMDESMVFATMGQNSTVPPTWDAMRKDDESTRYPISLFAAVNHPRWPPMVLGFSWTYQGRFVHVLHRSIDSCLGHQVLEHIWSQAADVPNPFRGSVVALSADPHGQLEIKLAAHRPLDRSSVVLPDHVWHQLDTNVSGLICNYEEMADRGLAATRGVLLHGPPGTGKTAAIRAIITEEQERASVIMCDAESIVNAAPETMKLAADLAPSIVVIEDIDRLVSDQNHGLLTALDGVEIDRSGVVILATANNVGKMGDAALRSARFDVKISIPLPDGLARRAILLQYLGDDFAGDVGRVVAATNGANGADLREIVSIATLEARTSGKAVETAHLVRTARTILSTPAGGFYL